MKFSIRDLFLVTVIVALVLGWGLDHWRQEVRHHDEIQDWRSALESESQWRSNLMQQVRKLGDKPISPGGPNVSTSLRNSSAPAPNPPKP
jgi:hypothetical protein